ncbi:MAG: hypothetical protein KAU48_10915 [Candidatus Thorarchaeota archaeon]|nr:hypothetical protein [Candidatus Thorarchaeota archaeon]
MNEEETLKTIEQESFRETREDGFNETNFGIMLLLLFNAIHEKPGYPSIFDLWFSLIVCIFGMLYFIFLLQFYKVFRNKYVYPRIGYVKLREYEPPKVTSGIIVVVILMIATAITLIYIISIGVVTTDLVYRWGPAIFGLIMWVASFYLKDRTGQNRYYLFGALMTITGVVVALAEFISTDMVIVIYFDGWGIAFLVLGVVKFVLFIRKYPIIGTPEVANSE